jgi:hypothetical protein
VNCRRRFARRFTQLKIYVSNSINGDALFGPLSMSVRVNKSISAIVVTLAAGAVVAPGAFAAMQSAISLSAAPAIIAADGKSTTIVTATVRGGDGGLVPDGTVVQFSTSLGTLDHMSATTSSGAARVTLTSSPNTGTAQVTATYLDNSGGGVGKGTLEVEFTADSDIASTDINSRWLRIDCPQYLVYSADGKIIQAEGKSGSAHLRYMGLTIDADSIQVDLQGMGVVARNATLHHGRASLTTAELRYDLYTSTGTAVLPATDTKGPQSVTVSGSKFDTVPLTAAAADEAVRTHVYGEIDLSNSRLVVSARAMSVDPGVQVQFTRAAIYSDGKKIVAMPYHVMPLTTNQLFGEQIVGYSSQGIFLNVPYYYHVSPDSMGTIYIRNSAASDAGISSGLAPTFGSGGTRPGLALDLQHTYSIGNSGSGTFVLNGLTRSDWGAYWNHSQRIDPITSSYFYVDYPEHRGIYGTSNLRRQFHNGASFSLSANENINPGYKGYSSNSSIFDAFLSSASTRLGRSGFSMVASTNWNQGAVNLFTPTGRHTTEISTQGADLRLFTAPIKPDKQTSITNSLSIGGSHSQLTGQSSYTIQGNLGATRTLPHNGQLAFNYNYSYDPLLNYAQATNQIGGYGISTSPLQQTLSLTGSMNPSKRSFVSFSTNYMLPVGQMSAFGYCNYRINNDWGIGVNALYERAFMTQFSTLEVSVTRRIFNRTIVFTYGTDTHRIRFDFGAGQF